MKRKETGGNSSAKLSNIRSMCSVLQVKKKTAAAKEAERGVFNDTFSASKVDIEVS